MKKGVDVMGILNLSRRNILAASMRLPLLAVSTLLPVVRSSQAFGNDAAKGQLEGNSRILVAYFSRSGNTRVIAGQIKRAHNADIFEILPESAYPEDYEDTVEQARKERDSAYEPQLKTTVANIKAYDTIFLGFPIWGETAPPVIRSFLSKHDLAGKTVVPFITHGGYGVGNSASVLARHAPQAKILKSFSMEADQEKRTLAQITQWLLDVKP